jgi:hypothetical protein
MALEMTTEATLITRDIEQTAQALQEVLLGAIAGTPFPTYHEYMAMAFVSQAFPIDRDTLEERHARFTSLTREATTAIVDNLIAMGMLAEESEGPLAVCAQGERAFGEVREYLTSASVRMHEGIPTEDLVVTRRTLTALRAAVARELADRIAESGPA